MFRTLYSKLAASLLGLFLLVGGILALTVERMPAEHVARFGGQILVAGIVFALLAALVIFSTLTRRLSRLATAMERFKASDFCGMQLPADLARRSGDEIDRLGITFHEMAELIGQQVRALRDSDRLQRELVANVSHDLRTPLAALRGYLETLLLKEQCLAPEERHNYLEIAARQSEHLSRLVGELFDLSKFDTEQVILARETFPMAELIQDVVQKYRPTAERKGVRLEATWPEPVPALSADIGLIERVLENLIENALRHTPAGGRVAVRLVAGANGICVDVCDTGQGIPAQELPHVFERFYRGEVSLVGKSGGAGLGLAIAKRIVELHGGTMQARSEAGLGAQFTFCLPAVAAKESRT